MVFIPFNTPSSKNSKIATSKGVFCSKTVKKYLSDLGIVSYNTAKKEVKFYKTKPCLFPVVDMKRMFECARKNTPVQLGFHFVRGTKHKFDFHNLCQVILDLLVAFDIIDDDNMDCVIPFPMKLGDDWYTIDKDNPGVYITILNPRIALPDDLYPTFPEFRKHLLNK